MFRRRQRSTPSSSVLRRNAVEPLDSVTPSVHGEPMTNVVPQDPQAQADQWLGQLTLDEKISLVSGASTWRTVPIERLGIPEVKMSDGPNGVRGEHVGLQRTAAVAMPTGMTMGATWDPVLMGRVGDLLGTETLRRSAHVVLAPAVNLHRTPVGGRTFEYPSEDPELTAALAVAMVQTIQAHDVGVTVKHFVGNDTEIDRHTVDVQIDERVLRELYLRPFEACVSEAGAWGVMSAYNQIDGEFCAANHRLLTEILRREWGFDGFVVSDWFGAHDSARSINGGLNLEMPGPARVHGAALAAAIAAGSVAESDLDAMVRDLLVLAGRTRAGERSASTPERSVDDPAERRLAREVATAGTVLARNDGVLPIDPASAPKVAVIGPNAKVTRIMGGGSSAVKPLPHTSILDALTERFGSVVYETGWNIDKYTPLPRPDQLLGPDGEPGIEFAFVNGPDLDAEPAYEGRSDTTSLRYLGSFPDGVDPGTGTLVMRGSFVPDVSGTHEIGAVVTGAASVVVGGRSVIGRDEVLAKSQAFYGYGSTEQRLSLDLRAGEPVTIEVELPLVRAFCGVRLGVAEPVPADQFERAVAAAADADVVIVVAGTNDDHETEGNDRTTIALPGRQDEFIAATAEVSDRIVVIVNAGSPVSMPWIDQVNAVLLPFFGGMEVGEAVADIVTGATDPGGRLPITFPKQLEDCPAWPHYAPVHGVQTYGEGFGMGYRGHDRSGVEPLLPFGHGLSYGQVEWGDASLTHTSSADGEVFVVTQPVTGGGDRPATVVVQGYVAPVDPPVDREPKALKVWQKLVVEPGETVEVELRFDPTAFRRWSVEDNGWTVDPGRYRLLIAASATDIRSDLEINLQ